MFDCELRRIQVQYHLRDIHSGSGQCSQWDVEGRGAGRAWTFLCLQKVSQGRALQEVVEGCTTSGWGGISSFQAQPAVDAQPTAKSSSTSPHRSKGGNNAGEWKHPTARTCRRKRFPPKPEVPLQNYFTALQTKDLSHQEQYWRLVRQSFYFFILIWMAFIFAICWMLLQTPLLSVVLFQVWRYFSTRNPSQKKILLTANFS